MVYPRGCGERAMLEQSPKLSSGLSPRMRGTAGKGKALLRMGRFIPADAGNGRPTHAHPVTGTVYPRGCGERWRSAMISGMMRGLSPRMRGTENGLSWGERVMRFIPADAGNGQQWRQ